MYPQLPTKPIYSNCKFYTDANIYLVRTVDILTLTQGQTCTYSRANNRKIEEEHVTVVVAVVTAESPACTINRVSCYMPAHMASLSKCEILIESSFSRA